MGGTETERLVAHRYEVGGLLGTGGMAYVHAGRDRRLRRDVAIKLLRPEMAARPEIRRRFETEAVAAARLSHPNAVAVFDTGEHDGTPFIVMELLPGETLADRIAAGPVDPEWMRGITLDALEALGAAHAAGIIHRDVKPGNILLTNDGHAKLADFGIAKVLDTDPTTTSHMLATPAYVAPERLSGAPASPQSDIYSLGVVLYEAHAGTKPFTATTSLALADAIRRGAHLPLADVRPGLDARLGPAVERAMALQPAHRFVSAREMADALAIDETRDATAVLPATAVPVGVAAARRPRRTRTLIGAGAVVVIALGAMTGALIGHSDAPAQPQPRPAPTTTVAAAPPTTALPPTTTVMKHDRGKGKRNGHRDEE